MLQKLGNDAQSRLMLFFFNIKCMYIETNNPTQVQNVEIVVAFKLEMFE